MEEEIMVATRTTIIDNDHGGAALTVELNTKNAAQSFIITECSRAYEVLTLFQAHDLEHCTGPVVACREVNMGYIVKLKRLPCYEPYEVSKYRD